MELICYENYIMSVMGVACSAQGQMNYAYNFVVRKRKLKTRIEEANPT
jgi:hypothetical protein